MDERQLIDGVLQGDPAAERLFYDRHLDRVWRLAYRLTGDGDLAQAVVQETFVRAFSKLGTFRRSAFFWLGQTGDPRGIRLFEEVLAGR